jgi:hypothetical protein
MPLVHRRIVQGSPIRVGHKQVVPEADVSWWMRHRATIGLSHASGFGVGVVRIRPVALVERGPGGSGRISIHDETARMLVGLAAGAVLIWFLAEIAIRLATFKGGEGR